MGDPDSWEPAGEWMTCGAEGSVSLVALVPLASVMDPDPRLGEDPWSPILAHVTACPAHARAVRRWLASKTPEPVDTYGTETFLREYSTVRETLGDTPLVTMAPARSA